MEPVAVACVPAWNGSGQGAEEAIDASRPTGLFVRSDASGNPGIRQRFSFFMRNRFQKSFEKEVIDIDTDVVMVE